MRLLDLALLLLAPAGLLMGQIDSDTITITSTRTAYTQPDQAVLSIAVGSMMPVNLDEVLAALQGSGITASNLTGTNGFSWSFALPVAFPQFQQTLTSWAALQESVQQKNPGLIVTFGVSGSQISPALQSQSCVTSDLVANASAQAQKLANVVGLTLGPVLSIATSPLPALYLANRVAGAGIPGLTAFITTTTNPAVNCNLTVRFKILR